MKRTLVIATLAVFLLGTAGCSSNRGKGGLIGAGAGAAIGAGIGKATGNTAMGAILGAAVGGTAGAIIGDYMDKQAAEMESDLEGTTIERVGEGIMITFDSGILFDYNSDQLRPVAKENLIRLAEILEKYDDTDIMIVGHTDSKGSDEYNFELSNRRAKSVANQLAMLQVNSARFSITGHGEAQPVATNETAEGRQLNRRVELAIMANEELQKTAEKQAG